MHTQESLGSIFGSDVNVSNANNCSVVSRDVRVDGFKRPVSDIGECRIGSTKQFHKVTLYMTLLRLGDLVGNN